MRSPFECGLACLVAMVCFPVSSDTPAQVFSKVKHSVVVVRVLDAQGKLIGQGSGVLIPNRRIVTNFHVVKDASRIEVGQGEAFQVTKFFGGDEDLDLALLIAPVSLPFSPAQIGSASTMKVGDSVYAVGSPQGLELTLSNGLVSALRGISPPIIQTTAPISPGSSGGGLFDGQGKLVGITTLFFDRGQNLNFAVPIDWVEQIKSGGGNQASRNQERTDAEWRVGATQLEKEENWTAAVAYSSSWIRSRPEDGLAWYCHGVFLGKLDRDQEALEAYRQAIRYSPSNSSAWNNLGLIYRTTKRPSDAIQAFKQAMKLDAKDAYYPYNLGLAYADAGQKQEAVNSLQAALSLDPGFANAWSQLGFAYMKMGNRQDSKNAFRQAVSINQDDHESWILIGALCIDLGEPYEALEAARTAREKGNRLTWEITGSAYSKLKKFDLAVEAFRKATRLLPKDLDCWEGLAVNLDASGDRPGAIEALKELRKLDAARAEKAFQKMVPK